MRHNRSEPAAVQPDAMSATAVTLTSSDGMVATVPDTVTIPAGQVSATFTVTGAMVMESGTAEIGAGYNGITRRVTVTVDPDYGCWCP